MKEPRDHSVVLMIVCGVLVFIGGQWMQHMSDEVKDAKAELKQIHLALQAYAVSKE